MAVSSAPSCSAEISDESIAKTLGAQHFLPWGNESLAVCDTEAQKYHMEAKTRLIEEWGDFHERSMESTDWGLVEKFVSMLLPASTEAEYKRLFREACRVYKSVPSKCLLTAAYYRLLSRSEISKNALIERLLLKKGIRSNSGVVVITVVTAPGPFSCPFDCHYCPNEPGQPRSYLSTEPAVARANQNKFCPVRQVYDRAACLAKQGHEIDKIEIIVLGGTWSGYPREYQEAFCRDLFFACNTFNEALAKARVDQDPSFTDPGNTGTTGGSGDVAAVQVQLSGAVNGKQRPRQDLESEQRLNETADCKIIGLTLETRPDRINVEEIRQLRWLGCTRVQLGVQHTDETILKLINRGHGLAEAVTAVKLLKESGFKVDIHLMPDLPGSNVEKDKEMFDYVLHTPHLQADHWKIYPCEVTPFSQIEKWHAEGQYTPYTEVNPEQLVELLVHVKSQVHPWIRLNRVIRDIPVESIIAGNDNVNLRQEIYKRLAKLNLACRCIRCREIRDFAESETAADAADTHLVRRDYRASDGDEIFLSIEGVEGDRGVGGGAENRGIGNRKTVKIDDNAPLYGLLRLRFNDDPLAAERIFPELKDCALIRELHVYGVVQPVRQQLLTADNPVDPAVQHVGYGKQLMAEAERIASARGFSRIAVIAGIGVRNYYRKRGYRLQGLFMVKELNPIPHSSGVAAPLAALVCDAKARARAALFDSTGLASVAAVAVSVALAGAALAAALVALRRSTRMQ